MHLGQSSLNLASGFVADDDGFSTRYTALVRLFSDECLISAISLGHNPCESRADHRFIRASHCLMVDDF